MPKGCNSRTKQVLWEVKWRREARKKDENKYGPSFMGSQPVVRSSVCLRWSFDLLHFVRHLAGR